MHTGSFLIVFFILVAACTIFWLQDVGSSSPTRDQTPAHVKEPGVLAPGLPEKSLNGILKNLPNIDLLALGDHKKKQISKSQPNQAGKLEAESLNILPQKESLLHYLGSAVPRQGLTWALWALISH